jgi:vacuolar-type H+-ATPase subunit I/STV1
MVFYFKSTCGQFLIYMGKDKYENEDLIKYGLEEDVWFHVDDLSSAHVYLRMKPGMTLDDLSEDIKLECASLVKANSIAGCKLNSVYVVYTRWKNLKKTNQMVEGQVSYHRPENVRRMKVEKNNAIVNKINKTKEEKYPDLYQMQQDRLREIQQQKKAFMKAEEKRKKLEELQRKKEKEEKSYDRIFEKGGMISNSELDATADNTAAEAYEDDFF